jgi:DNA/RNA-binding domain of Phe-tRNA-synthetase-like protein
MIDVTATPEWSAAHPGGAIGLLEISGVDNSSPSHELNQRKRETEAHLRTVYAGYGRQDFLALPVMAAYEKYYRHFDKTYHVLLQVESIVLKARNLPDVSPLVDANFTAEVCSLVLTAGHDVTKLEMPVVIDVSYSGDEIVNMNGEHKPIRPGDMVMRDRHGVRCSILYGQDNRSPISAQTTDVLYVAYAPAGVAQEQVRLHLQQIEENIRLFAPSAVVEQNRLLIA